MLASAQVWLIALTTIISVWKLTFVMSLGDLDHLRQFLLEKTARDQVKLSAL
jgi:hypothetical protein